MIMLLSNHFGVAGTVQSTNFKIELFVKHGVISYSTDKKVTICRYVTTWLSLAAPCKLVGLI